MYLCGMKHLSTLVLTFALLLSALSAAAQTEEPGVQSLPAEASDALVPDDVFTPASYAPLTPMMPPRPYANLWQPREGLSATVGLSASVGWGKHAPHGVGFGEHLALAFTRHLGHGFTVSAGLLAQHQNWGAAQRSDASVAALVSYAISDRISVFAYGVKSFLPERNRYYPGLSMLPMAGGDRYGAGASFKIGESAMIQVAVEHADGPAYWGGIPMMTPFMPYGW